MSESRADGDGLPTTAEVDALRDWQQLMAFDAAGDGAVNMTVNDGRIIIQAASAEAARGLEDVARTHEEMHEQNWGTLMLAMCEALARGVAAGPGPWAPNNPATEKGRDDLRRAGFEERHDGEFGTVWERPADGTTLKPREALFVVPVELDLRGGRSR